MPATDVFGRWLMTDQPTDHYFLNGKPLCGLPVVLVGGPRPDKVFKCVDTWCNVSHRCPACHRLNLERWGKM